MALGFQFGVVPSIGLLFPRSQAEVLMQESAALNDVDGGMTFTRATSAWDPYNNVIVAPGVRRRRSATLGRFRAVGFDLIEGARTNLLAAGSSELAIGWGTAAASLVAGSGISPNGEAMKLLQEDTSNSTHYCEQAVTKAASGLPYAFTFWANSSNRSLQINLDNGAGTAGVYAIFNLANGTITTTSTAYGSGWTAGTATIVAANNGNYRCLITGTTSTETTIKPFIYLYSGGTITYVGDGASGASLWGACLEQAAFASSYISNRNLLTHSGGLSNAAWVKSNITAVDNNATDPNGNLTASTITASNANGSIYHTATVVAGNVYTFSWWVKAGTAVAPVYLIYDQTNSANISTAAYTPTASLARKTVTFTAPAGCTTVRVEMVNTMTTLGTLIIWQPQVENGSTATVNWAVDATVGGRDADNLTATYVAGTGSAALLGMIIPYGWSVGNGGSAFLYDESTTSGLAASYSTNAGVCHSRREDANAVQDSPGAAGSPSNGVLQQVGSTWDGAHVTCYRNGVAGTPTAVTPPMVTTAALQMGASQTNANPLYGWICVIAFSRALVASEFIALATALPVAA